MVSVALRRYVTAIAAAAGAILVIVVGVGGLELADPVALGGYVVLIALTSALPPVLLVNKDDDNGESLQFDELFIVAMGLRFPPAEVLVGFALGVAIAHLARRRAPIKTVFNIGQEVLSAAAALAVMAVFHTNDGLGPAQLIGAAAGAVVFFVVNLLAMSGVLAITRGGHVRDAVFDAFSLKLTVLLGNASLGLLVGIVSESESWAWPFAVAPAVLLHLAFRGHLRARQAEQHVTGLLDAASRVHSTIGLADVEAALLDSVRTLLVCEDAALRADPPRTGEIGVPVHVGATGRRWLVAAGKRGLEGFRDADVALLDAIATTTSTALDNAALFEQVAVERRKMTDVVGSSSDGILSVDADQRVQSWNPAMERITGFPAADVIGAKCFTVFRPRDEAGNDLCIANCPGRASCAQGSEPVDVQITTVNGEQRWLTCTYSPMPDGGYVVVARDITAQKQVDDLKADFLATVSHELRTPLTPIQGFLHTLMRDDVEFEPAQRMRFYEVMLRQSERLERLVKDLLDATSLQDQDQLFLPEEVDWTAAISHVVELFRAQEPGREFLIEIAHDVPHVVADEQRAEQVLNNLLSNAVKYSGATDPVRVTVEARGDRVVTTVADRGPGVSPADRDRIFERFTRLGDHLTRRVGGAGLGLFIAKRLVEAMGGEIMVSAAPEGGAAFSFSLPQYARQPDLAGGHETLV